MSAAAIAPACAEALPPPGVGVAAAMASVNCSRVILESMSGPPRNRRAIVSIHRSRARPIVGMEIYDPPPGVSRGESAGSLVRSDIAGGGPPRLAGHDAVFDHGTAALHDRQA